MKTKKIVFIGGDERMLFAADMFAQNGFEATVCGFDLPFGEYDKIKKRSNASSPCPHSFGEGRAFFEQEITANAALACADYAVLPPVVSRDGKNIFAPFSKKEIPVGELEFGETPVLCGAFCPHISAKTFCYALRESFAVSNALPTAESALKIAMEETQACVCGMRACVLGFGRIGKLLTKNLVALGARTEVFARRSEARAWAEALGARAHGFGELEAEIAGYDCIFNTVPENVISAEALAKIKKGTPIIELASAPGGAEAKECEKAGVRLVQAGGLPGKIMPRTAGKIIYETVKEMIDEEEKR